MNRIEPMWAETAPEPFDTAEYVYEKLYDGLRCVAYVNDGNVELIGRHGRDYTRQFPELAAIAGQVNARRTVLDGELVVFQERAMDISAVMGRTYDLGDTSSRLIGEEPPATYIAFDLLSHDDWDMTAAGAAVPFSARRARLEELLNGAPRRSTESESPMRLVDQVHTDGVAYFDEVVADGFEGLMAKQTNGLYYPGQRRAEWLKVKGFREGSFIISGLSQGEGRRAGSFGALLLGRIDARGWLLYYGCVGSGFTERDLRNIKGRAEGLAVEESPFHHPVRDTQVAMFLRPELIVDVKYHEITSDGRLRHPVFMRLRPDLWPGDCGS